MRNLDFKTLAIESLNLAWMYLVFLFIYLITLVSLFSLVLQAIEGILSWIRYGSGDINLIWDIKKNLLEFAPKTELIGLNKIISFLFSDLGRLLILIIIGIPNLFFGMYLDYKKDEFKKLFSNNEN